MFEHLNTATEKLATVSQGDDAGGLKQRQPNSEVTRVLRHLCLSGLAFLLQLLKVRNNHRQQLHNNRRRDVGHNADGEDR